MPTQPLTMQFQRGLDLRRDLTAIAAPSLYAADNVYFDRDGALRKRSGYTALSKQIYGGGTIAKGASVFAYNSELLMSDNANMYSWNANAQQWVVRGPVVPTIVSDTMPPFNPGTLTGMQYVRSGQYDYYVYDTPAGTLGGSPATSMAVKVVDVATQALVYDGALGSATIYDSNWRLVQTPVGAMVLLRQAYAGSLFIATPVSPTGFGASQTIATLTMAAFAFGAAYDGSAVIVAWQDQAGAMPLHVRALASDGTLSAQYCQTNDINSAQGIAATVAVACNPALPAQCYISAAFYAAATSSYHYYFSNLTTSNPPTLSYGYFLFGAPTASLGNMSADGSYADFVYDVPVYPYAGSTVSTTLTQMMTAGAVTSNYPSSPLKAISAPFRYNGNLYSWVQYQQQVGVQRTYPFTGSQTYAASIQTVGMLYNWSASTFVAKLGFGELALSALRNVTQMAADTFALPYVANVALKSTAGVSQQPSSLTLLQSPILGFVRFCNAYELQSAYAGEQLFLANGLPYSYDGAHVTEHGFTVAPDIIGLAEVANSSSQLTVGTRSYVALWEWTDAQGQVHQSAVSSAFSYTRSSVSAFKAQLSYAPLVTTSKQNVNIVFFRTTANGSVYFRLGTQPANGLGTTAFLFTDNNDNDATLQGGAILYTVGGELNNDAPPACTCVSASATRLYLAGTEDSGSLTYSKEYVKGTGLGFSLALTQRFDLVPGPVTGSAHVDDKHFAFKKNAIIYWAGEGPTANGANSDFTQTIVLSNTVGCSNSPSIVRAGNTILFSANPGVYALDGGLSLTYVGQPAVGAQPLPFTTAVLMPDAAQVRFGAPSGSMLVYHYEMQGQYDRGVTAGQWTTFSNYAQVGATIWQGNYTFIKADGTVCVENGGYADNGSIITLTIQTGWLRPAGPLEAGDFAEFAILGWWRGAHTLRVDQYADYSWSTLGELSFPAGTAVTGSAFGAAPLGIVSPWGGDGDVSYALRGQLPVSTPTVGAMQLRFRDAPIPGTPFGDSATLSSLTIMASTDGQLLRAPQKKYSG